jgi:hypothetical protein
MKIHSNPAMFKQMSAQNYAGKKKGMAVKTVDRAFLQGQSIDLFRAAIRSPATRDPYERWLMPFEFKYNTSRTKKVRSNIPLLCLSNTPKNSIASFVLYWDSCLAERKMHYFMISKKHFSISSPFKTKDCLFSQALIEKKAPSNFCFMYIQLEAFLKV